jgi:hypothetical protein
MIFKDGNVIAPGIVIYENVINNSSEIINVATKESDLWQKATVSNKENVFLVNDETRVADTFFFSKYSGKSDVFDNVSELMWKYGDSYAKFFKVGFEFMESPQMLKYEKKSGFYKQHIDKGPKNPREFSAILYLNDVYEGGETYFEHFDIAIPSKSGRMVIFPANYPYIHEAIQPKSDDKFAIVTWFISVKD